MTNAERLQSGPKAVPMILTCVPFRTEADIDEYERLLKEDPMDVSESDRGGEVFGYNVDADETLTLFHMGWKEIARKGDYSGMAVDHRIVDTSYPHNVLFTNAGPVEMAL